MQVANQQRRGALPHPRLFQKDAELHQDLADAYKIIADLQYQLAGLQQELADLKGKEEPDEAGRVLQDVSKNKTTGKEPSKRSK